MFVKVATSGNPAFGCIPPIKMAYKFSYQKILNVKQIQEDQKSTEVSLAQNELNKEKDTLSELKSKKSKVLNDENTSIENPADMLRHTSYVKQVNQTIENQKKQIQKMNDVLKSKKEELLTLHKTTHIFNEEKKSHRFKAGGGGLPL